ncbi:hypothetical protein EEL51_02840 [Muribaculaceae bacterium Isolate-110 (HZI)]|nr:hypothetical protein EEL51_02840 [Muribaculaceae bacterium Isolate-110 (HZI)]
MFSLSLAMVVRRSYA